MIKTKRRFVGALFFFEELMTLNDKAKYSGVFIKT